MKKEFDDFAKMKIGDMCKSISDMTYMYIDPETQKPTVVPAAHYEKLLNRVQETYMSEITRKGFLNVMYNQLLALKKENEEYYQQALICLDLGINPKDMRVNEQIALDFTQKCLTDRQVQEKKKFHLLDKEILNIYDQAINDMELQAKEIAKNNFIMDIEDIEMKQPDGTLKKEQEKERNENEEEEDLEM